MEMITLEQYEQIRRMYHLEEKSGRQIARELSCSRQTVSIALCLDQLKELVGRVALFLGQVLILLEQSIEPSLVRA